MNVPSHEGQMVGIDLGTNFSAIARFGEQGKPGLIANEEGDLRTPSIVMLTPDGRATVGVHPARAAMEDSGCVVRGAKRFLGEAAAPWTLGGHPLPAEPVIALLLKKLCRLARKTGEHPGVVLTVPCSLYDAQRKALDAAARIAGIASLELLPEPVAATLAYAWRRKELAAQAAADTQTRTILVYSLGGGMFEAAAVRYTPQCFEVLDAAGDLRLGGGDWDERLADHVAKEFQSRYGTDLHAAPAAWEMLRWDCELAKGVLSEKPEAVIACRHAGKSLSLTVSRAQFEEMTADLLERTARKTMSLLKRLKAAGTRVDAVLTVGCGTLMSQVSAMLQKLTGRPPSSRMPPDVTVVQGAALYAAVLQAKHRAARGQAAEGAGGLAAVNVENIAAHGLGLAVPDPKTREEVNRIVIPRSTRLPAEVRKNVKTNRPGQQRMSLQLIQGDAPLAKDCRPLGKCRIVGLPGDLPEGTPVEVTYALDAAGRVRISAAVKDSGQPARAEIERPGGLEESQIEAWTKRVEQFKIE